MPALVTPSTFLTAAVLAMLGAGCDMEPLRTADLLGTGHPDAATPAADAAGDLAGLCPKSGMEAGVAEPVPMSGDSSALAAPNACGGDFVAPMGPSCGSLKDLDPCDPAAVSVCHATCGPLKSGIENCQCTSACPPGHAAPCLVCGPCMYDPARSYACFRRPSAPRPCPRVSTAAGPGLIQSGSPCDWPDCMACGDASGMTYQDMRQIPKAGYCVCSASCKWSCASSTEWPQACLTDR